MTPTTLAETILRDVIRCDPAWNNEIMRVSADGDYVQYDDVLTALTAAMDPAIAERAGEVLEGVTPDWEMDATGVYDRVLYAGGIVCVVHSTEADARFIAWCREGVPALLAQNAALRAEVRKSAMDAVSAGCQAQEAWEAQKAADAQIAALTARVEGLTGAGTDAADDWEECVGHVVAALGHKPDWYGHEIASIAGFRATLSTTEEGK